MKIEVGKVKKEMLELWDQVAEDLFDEDCQELTRQEVFAIISDIWAGMLMKNIFSGISI